MTNEKIKKLLKLRLLDFLAIDSPLNVVFGDDKTVVCDRNNPPCYDEAY